MAVFIVVVAVVCALIALGLFLTSLGYMRAAQAGLLGIQADASHELVANTLALVQNSYLAALGCILQCMIFVAISIFLFCK